MMNRSFYDAVDWSVIKVGSFRASFAVWCWKYTGKDGSFQYCITANERAMGRLRRGMNTITLPCELTLFTRSHPTRLYFSGSQTSPLQPAMRFVHPTTGMRSIDFRAFYRKHRNPPMNVTDDHKDTSIRDIGRRASNLEPID